MGSHPDADILAPWQYELVNSLLAAQVSNVPLKEDM